MPTDCTSIFDSRAHEQAFSLYEHLRCMQLTPLSSIDASFLRIVRASSIDASVGHLFHVNSGLIRSGKRAFFLEGINRIQMLELCTITRYVALVAGLSGWQVYEIDSYCC